jgi:hypothetical protein
MNIMLFHYGGDVPDNLGQSLLLREPTEAHVLPYGGEAPGSAGHHVLNYLYIQHFS